ncbi:MAG: TonB-dependent receptor [Acidobacteria bacterium]|nr:TonB-dependent receptor [Acidobacteriota bacterium]
MAIAPANAQVRLTGVVLTPTHAPVSGVRVWVECESLSLRWQQYSDNKGHFELELSAGVAYRISATREGYFPVAPRSIDVTSDTLDVTLTMEPVRERLESVEVKAGPIAVDMDSTSSRRLLTSRDIINIPYPNTNDLRSALRTIPGVTRDSRGGLHVNGASEEQMLITWNGFNLNDPLTGKFQSRFSVESIQSVDVTGGNVPAEIGKGAGGALALQTKTGDDQFRYSATNFFPGVENRKGWIIGDWTPRLGISGPIRRGRTWISDSVDLQYMKTVVRDLPLGEDRSVNRALSNLFHLQHNVSGSNLLSAGFLVNLATANRTGLTALDPFETTIDRRARQWFLNVKDQIFLRNRTVIEVGVASNRTFGREIPQGHQLLSLTPQGRRGNFFSDSRREASRAQVLVNIAPPALSWKGRHNWKTGIDLDRLDYSQDVSRTGYENYGETGLLRSRTLFGGSGRLRKTNAEASLYVQDSWRMRQNLLVELGVRGDWDRILGDWTTSPRVGAAWSPRGEGTKLYGGYSWIADATNLRLMSRPLDQHTLSTYFFPDGVAARGPALSFYSIGNAPLLRPTYGVLSLGAAHRFGKGVVVRADAHRRRGSRGFTYLNANANSDQGRPLWLKDFHAVELDANYQLSNYRRDAFDSVAVSVRHSFGDRWEWAASYTRSRALSNAVVDVSVEDPIIVTQNIGPMPWDSPHRLQGWGYLPLLRRNWAVAFLLDTRSGYPFSVQGSDSRIVGDVNSRRFPLYFELNVHIERKFQFRGHQWAWRIGANNITGRINPDTVNNIVDSSQYLRFYGGTGRAFNARIRWLGKVAR